MNHDQDDMQALEEALHSAAARPPDVPQGLMARVLADAERAQRVDIAAPPSPGLWAVVRSNLGGWQGLGGLVAATCAGFWIGISPPDMVPSADDVIFGALQASAYDAVADTFAFGWELEEG